MHQNRNSNETHNKYNSLVRDDDIESYYHLQRRSAKIRKTPTTIGAQELT